MELLAQVAIVGPKELLEDKNDEEWRGVKALGGNFGRSRGRASGATSNVVRAASRGERTSAHLFFTSLSHLSAPHPSSLYGFQRSSTLPRLP